jgi:hypothetical protein
MKLVIVPQADLDKLKEARTLLYALLKDTQYEYEYELPYNSISVLWEKTHKRYPELEEK